MAQGFEAAYLEGFSPWDIGRPQTEFVRLCDAGRLIGNVIDAGCGTGENALYLASKGLDVVGIDLAPAAIERARRKASERGLDARFEVADVLDLSAFAESFDCGIDSGCFHTFDDERRARYVRSLHGALRPQGRMFVLCFSDRQPGTWGPRRVTEPELRDAFREGWSVDEVRRGHFDVKTAGFTRPLPPPSDTGTGLIEAWLGALTRL